MKNKKIEIFMENDVESLRRWIHSSEGTNEEIIRAITIDAEGMDMIIKWIKINGKRVKLF